MTNAIPRHKTGPRRCYRGASWISLNHHVSTTTTTSRLCFGTSSSADVASLLAARDMNAQNRYVVGTELVDSRLQRHQPNVPESRFATAGRGAEPAFNERVRAKAMDVPGVKALLLPTTNNSPTAMENKTGGYNNLWLEPARTAQFK